MTNKEEKNTIGKKIEESYLSDRAERAPSKETVAKWIEIADQRRAQIRRRKRKIISFAAAVALIICISVTCLLAPPDVLAGGCKGAEVEAGLSTNDVYVSEQDIPNNLKQEFVWFSDIPTGYEFVEAKIQSDDVLKKIQVLYSNPNKEDLLITETVGDERVSSSATVDPAAIKESWKGLDVYIIEYDSDARETVYFFIYGHHTVNINASENIERNEIKTMVENAVQN